MKKGILYPCFKHWEEKNTIWVYSDPHFGDEQARAFRKELLGWDIDDDEKVRRINSRVGKNDIIIFLGDIGDTEYIKQIRGYKVLIMGNHDSGKTNYERVVTEIQTFDSENIKAEDIQTKVLWHRTEGKMEILDTRPLKKYFHTEIQDNGLFDEVYDGPLTLNKKVILSHVPFLTEYFFNIHGHVHHGSDPQELGINMCCEFHEYYPINLNDILYSGKLKEVKDLNRQQIERRLEEKFPMGWHMQKCVSCGKIFKTSNLYQDTCNDCVEEVVKFNDTGGNSDGA